MTTALAQAREDARFRIVNYANELTMGEGDEQDANGLFAISWEHRQLAICRLLQDGDAVAFQRGMRRAALTFTELLTRAEGGKKIPARILLGSNWDGLSAALVAADLVQAGLLAARFPAQFDAGREYLDDYLPFASMAHAVLHPGDHVGMAALCQRWEAADDGSDPSEGALWLALATGDQAAFSDQLAQHIERRRETMAAYRKTQGYLKTTAATEGGLFVDGLAILQLAKARGLTWTDPIPMCPRLAFCAPSPEHLEPSSWMRLD